MLTYSFQESQPSIADQKPRRPVQRQYPGDDGDNMANEHDEIYFSPGPGSLASAKYSQACIRVLLQSSHMSISFFTSEHLCVIKGELELERFYPKWHKSIVLVEYELFQQTPSKAQ